MKDEKKGIFREQAVRPATSADQLGDYIKTAKPGIWLALSAVIVLLAGVFIWAVFGHIDTRLQTVGVAADGGMTVYVKAEDRAAIEVDQTVRIGEREYRITGISQEPLIVDDRLDAYALHLGGFQPGEWVYEAAVQAEEDPSVSAKDGSYPCEIVTERIKPISFIFH